MANLPFGLDVIVVPPPKAVKRSWRERLLTRPWRPWKGYRTVEHPMWGLVQHSVAYRHGNVIYVSTKAWSDYLSKSPNVLSRFDVCGTPSGRRPSTGPVLWPFPKEQDAKALKAMEDIRQGLLKSYGQPSAYTKPRK